MLEALGLVKSQPGKGVLARVGYVPQRLALERSFILSVREFLALQLRSTHSWFWRSHRSTDRELSEVLGELGIANLLDRPIASLSGGQLQRVLIAFKIGRAHV